MTPTNDEDITSSMQGISLKSQHARQASRTQPKRPVADSWEQESSADEDDAPGTPTEVPTRARLVLSDYPSAPPPTPSAPYGDQQTLVTSDFSRLSSAFGSSLVPSSSSNVRSTDRRVSIPDGKCNVRNEKTTATASRMIAGALGVRAPKRSEDQKMYEKAVKENEMARRERERAEKTRDAERKEKARKDAWDG